MNYLYIDFETTGLDSNLCAPIEIAAIPVIHGEKLEPFVSNIKPFTNASVSNEALSVTGKKITEIYSYEDQGIVFKRFNEWLNTFDTMFCIKAYNSEFDEAFLQSWFQRNGSHTDYIHKFYPGSKCILKEARRKIKIKSYKLGNVCKHLNIELTNAHSALNDTIASLQVDELLQGMDKSIENDIKMNYKQKRSKYLGNDMVTFGNDGSIFINDKCTRNPNALRFVLEEIYNRFVE
jgi:DNA polymerase III alpha subunit (gram-positive type)